MRSAVDDLVDELIDRGIPARVTIYIVAAMALVHYERVAAGDLDASYFPADDIAAAAADVAARLGLAEDWLNSAATAFLPPIPDELESPVIIGRGGVTITARSTQLLLAMKLRASRPGRNGNDIAVLVRACGMRTLPEAQAVLDEIYLSDSLESPAGVTKHQCIA